MSSHREAPEITKDPVADNTDIYAFVSPDKPDTVTIIANYVPLEDPAGGPNFYEFGDDVLYEIHVDNDGDGAPTSRTSSSSRTSCATRHVPLQHRADHVARQPELEPAPVLLGHQGQHGRARATTTASTTAAQPELAEHLPSPPCNIGPRSTPNYRGAGPGGGARPAQRRDGVRRPAQRGLLRRPRARSSTSATCGRSRTCTSSPTVAGDGRRRDREAQRAHDRDPGADHGPDRGTAPMPHDPMSTKAVLGVWGAASRRKVRLTDHGQRRARRDGPVGAGVAARQPAVQRGRRAAGRQGPLERAARRPTTTSSPSTSSTPSWRACCRALPGRVPEPRRR